MVNGWRTEIRVKGRGTQRPYNTDFTCIPTLRTVVENRQMIGRRFIKVENKNQKAKQPDAQLANDAQIKKSGVTIEREISRSIVTPLSK